MKLILPLDGAPTDNRRLIFAPRLGRFVSSSEYREWKIGAIWSIKKQWGEREMLTPTFEKQIAYRVTVFMESKRTDQVNWDKGARDILTEAGVWHDDRWTYPIYTPCQLDKMNPRMEIEIENTP